jgi:16S rRNA (cytosine967-C5)-methyltransferase
MRERSFGEQIPHPLRMTTLNLVCGYTFFMAISSARKIAFDVLRRVAAENAYAADLLFTQLEPAVKKSDASLATELTLGVLRWQRLLDFLLQRHMERRRCEQLDLEVLLALRLGLYQLRYLDRVPQHAAINESVELVKRARKSSAAGMVNAVLRRVAAEARIAGAELEKLIPAGTPAEERLGVLYSHPSWLVARWTKLFGKERTIALMQANNRPAPLTCAVLEEETTDRVAEALRKSGLEVAPGRWLRGALQISGGNPGSSGAYHEGQINFQDEASQMVAHLVDARDPQTILDACAAPGGKTMILARAAGPQGRVIAGDIHEHRLRMIQQQLKRTHAKNVSLAALDATRPLPFSERFDRVLMDAPCSGTGTLSRNPEIRWRLKGEDLIEAHRSQTAMLRNSLAAAGKSGRVVYSTCSLEPEENENVVAAVLGEAPEWQVISGQAALARHLRNTEMSERFFADDGFFRTFPPEHGIDGFFAAVLARR